MEGLPLPYVRQAEDDGRAARAACGSAVAAAGISTWLLMRLKTRVELPPADIIYNIQAAWAAQEVNST